MNLHRLSLSLPVVSIFTCLAGSAACGSSRPALPPASAAVAPDAATDAKLQQALAGPARTDKEKARDVYRHPRETLGFFGLRDDMTVVEISPGGGWYTAILAPVLRERGQLRVVDGDPNGDPKSEGTRNAQGLQKRFQGARRVRQGAGAHRRGRQAGELRRARVGRHGPHLPQLPQLGGRSVDGPAPGGRLRSPQARRRISASPTTAQSLETTTDPKVVGDTGYVPEDYVVETIERAGFKLGARSDVNANPKDMKDYAKGVPTLPPTYELGDTDHAKYEAIGESDRMTLRFVKP